MASRFPSDVGHGAMRARRESPRVRYATPGFLAGTTRAPRRRQLPTKRCHAALLFGVIRAYQPDSSSKPLHRQPCVGVLGKSFRPTREMPGSRHRRRDRRRRHKPLDGRSFHISEGAARTLLKTIQARLTPVGSAGHEIEPQWTVGATRVPAEITMVGHSMGAIIANRLLAAVHPLRVARIVYLAPAAGIDDFEGFLLPYLAHHPRTRFALFSLSR